MGSYSNLNTLNGLFKEVYGDKLQDLIGPRMKKEEWEKMGRIGFGNIYWQDYSLDDKGFLFVYTNSKKPEFPEHLPYIYETKESWGSMDKGCVFRFQLVE